MRPFVFHRDNHSSHAELIVLLALVLPPPTIGQVQIGTHFHGFSQGLLIGIRPGQGGSGIA